MKTYIVILTTFITMFLTGCNKNTITNSCKGDAIEDCMCTMQYDPVCGCDGKTYGNACAANCANVKEYTKGECNK